MDGPEVLHPILDVSHETIGRLEAFDMLLRKWQRKTNLVGSDTLDAYWSHHVGDGAFLYAHAPDVPSWIDIGSGAGLPGLILAILAAGEGKAVRVELVESNAKKCAFQRAAVLELGLRADVDVRIVNRRIEEHRATDDATLTARALAPLSDLLIHMRTLGLRRGLFLKGERHVEEIAQAGEASGFVVETIPHPLRQGSVLLDVRLPNHRQAHDRAAMNTASRCPT